MIKNSTSTVLEMNGLILDNPKGAIFSPDRKYRYVLWRSWAGQKVRPVVFIGLNPSTADEWTDDPTIRRCIGFASSWGYNTLYMLNLFAFRSANPNDLRKPLDPIGPENDRWLKEITNEANLIVVAWGDLSYQARKERAKRVLAIMEGRVFCLGLTQRNFPRHPLYVLKSRTPLEFKQE